MVHSLIPNRETLASQLEKLCRVCHADEVVLFERATFLVISHTNAPAAAQKQPYADAHRFEKISNIVKQFKCVAAAPSLRVPSYEPMGCVQAELRKVAGAVREDGGPQLALHRNSQRLLHSRTH